MLGIIIKDTIFQGKRSNTKNKEGNLRYRYYDSFDKLI